MTAQSRTLLVLNRNHVLNTTKGHSVVFWKNVPTHVPPALYQDALAIGAVPADGSPPVVNEPAKTTKGPVDPAERTPLIFSAIERIVAENARENFTAAGHPSPDAVSRLVGFKVGAREIAPVWQSFNERIAEGTLSVQPELAQVPQTK